MEKPTGFCCETHTEQLEKLLGELFQQEDLGPEEMHEVLSLIMAEYLQYPDYYESTCRQEKIQTLRRLLQFLVGCKRCLQSEG